MTTKVTVEVPNHPAKVVVKDGEDVKEILTIEPKDGTPGKWEGYVHGNRSVTVSE